MNVDKTPKVIKNMFNNIANSYDLMNVIISLGTDKIIKTKCIESLKIPAKSKILDLCTGTGDLVEIMQAKYSKLEILAVDFSSKMLEIAKRRIKNVEFIEADATNLLFEDEVFDFITVSYGLRNIQDRAKAINEMYRVLKTGGKVLHLDFGEKNFAGQVFEKVVPMFAQLLKKDYKSYEYLVKSKQTFPQPAELMKEFEMIGFDLYSRKDFLFKSISAQVFEKVVK